ncbi:hypothetical protein [Gimesia chilikensis]|uniref:Nucleotidyltransferase n=1 Tax=Gimesia chilikensis TaxID=2605989 RepID=A0A517PY99_9PLAN|nr:hypothetical protein [Gimesia chilikensis]QDT24353.1 hypothetical protein HG66A1_61850 [Gimesia chilikensis]
MELTKRQKTLFDRLVTLGEWANTGELPYHPLEILGFGSFFRGKRNPNDIDLIFRIPKEHLPEFDEFVQLLYEIRNDWDLEERNANPHDALVELRTNEDQRVANFSDSVFRKYLNWIKPYSWNMLRPNDIHQHNEIASPYAYSKRMIKMNLPKLNVVSYLSPEEEKMKRDGLRCGFVVSIWSKDSPDTVSNLKRLLSEECVVQNLARELAYFDVQISEVSAYKQLLEAEIELLLKIPRRRKAKNGSIWFDEYSESHANLVVVHQGYNSAKEASKRFDEEQWGKEIDIKIRSVAESAKTADQSRKTLKELYRLNDMLESIRNVLAYFKSGEDETELNAKEYVVDCILKSGSQKLKDEKAEFLRNRGFPVDHVLKKKERDHRKHISEIRAQFDNQ